MTLEEFNILDYESKLFTIVDKGNFIDNYVTVEVKINLYTVDKFYTELVYDGQLNKIVEIRSFKSGIHLDKYTNYIELDFGE